MSEANAKGLDCPITSVPPVVSACSAVIFGSGDKETFEQCAPVFEGITNTTYYPGPFDMGSKMKFVSHTLVAIHNLATAEVVSLSEKAGFDFWQILQVITGSAACSNVARQ